MNRELRPLGERLRGLREQHYMNQAEVADALDVAVTTYRNYERDSIVPKTKELVALADLYDLTVDDILGFGTKYSFRYDRMQLDVLRQAVKGIDIAKIESALVPLLKEHENAFSFPNMTKRQMEIYANNTIRTVSYNYSDEQLVFYAQDRLSQLKYMKRLIHDGYYYSLDIPEVLQSIRNPYYSEVYTNADAFRRAASDLFARVLADKFGYGIYAMGAYIFCKKGEQYIDVRGWTEDFTEFSAGLPAGRPYTKDMMGKYSGEENIDPEGVHFTEWLIDQNLGYYKV